SRAGRARRVTALALALAALAGAASLAVCAAPASTTMLLPGAPPALVVDTIGNGTPQVSSKIDPSAARFVPDPTLGALGRRIFIETR
ncbi:cytochrome B6, partial [Burkholderia pseudomallei]